MAASTATGLDWTMASGESHLISFLHTSDGTTPIDLTGLTYEAGLIDRRGRLVQVLPWASATPTNGYTTVTFDLTDPDLYERAGWSGNWYYREVGGSSMLDGSVHVAALGDSAVTAPQDGYILTIVGANPVILTVDQSALAGAAAAGAAAASPYADAAAVSAAAALVSENNAAADEALTDADAIATAADAVATAADVVLTNADVVATDADATATDADKIAAAASAAAALVSENNAAADEALTDADAIATAADAVATAADAVSTSTDASTATTQASNAATSASNASTSESNADADATATAADAIATAADAVSTAADAVTTAADAVSTDADKTAAAASAAAALASENAAAATLANATVVSYGSGSPSATPSKVGDVYIDTTADEAYIATDAVSSSDWDLFVNAGGLANVEDDTSPTLGGTLSLGAYDITGKIIGTDVQAWDAALDDFAGLTQAADTLPFFSSATGMQTVGFTPLARTLVNDPAQSSMRATIGVVIGTDVQGYDAALDAVTGINTGDDPLAAARTILQDAKLAIVAQRHDGGATTVGDASGYGRDATYPGGTADPDYVAGPMRSFYGNFIYSGSASDTYAGDTNDLILAVRTPVANTCRIMDHSATATGSRGGAIFEMLTAGTLQFYWHQVSDGAAQVHTSTSNWDDVITPGEFGWVRAYYDDVGGTIDFYASADSVSTDPDLVSWTSLGQVAELAAMEDQEGTRAYKIDPNNGEDCPLVRLVRKHAGLVVDDIFPHRDIGKIAAGDATPTTLSSLTTTSWTNWSACTYADQPLFSGDGTDDYLTQPVGTWDFLAADSVTFLCLVRFTDDVDAGSGRILENKGTGGYGIRVWQDTTSGVLSAGVWGLTTSTATMQVTGTVVADTTQFVALRCDAGTATLQLDATRASTDTYTGDVTSDSACGILSTGVGSATFAGDLMAFCKVDRALTDTELDNLHAALLDPETRPLALDSIGQRDARGYTAADEATAVANTAKVSFTAADAAAVVANTAKVSNRTHYGDIDGSYELTIGADKVTYAKLQNVTATDRIMGRVTGGAGDMEELTGSQASTIIGAPIISQGAGAPGSTPSAEGDIYVDTTGDNVYVAAGTASSADWKQATGAGGGDLLAANNLSDVAVAATALTNLGGQTQDDILDDLSGLTQATDKLPYFSSATGMATTDITSQIRLLLDDTSTGEMRGTLGLSIGSDVQAHSAIGDDLSGLTQATDQLPYFDSATTMATTTITATARTLLDDTSVSTMRATLEVQPGNHVQAYDADLTALAGLSSAADKLPYFTGSNTAAVTNFTATARTLLDDASIGDMRATLGLGTIATQSAAAVAITGGDMSGVNIAATQVPVTTSRTLIASDAHSKMVTMDSGTAQNIVVNTSVFAADDVVEVINLGAGVVTFTGTCTKESAGSLLSLEQSQGAFIFFETASLCTIIGGLS